jgi:hypothetical protein
LKLNRSTIIYISIILLLVGEILISYENDKGYTYLYILKNKVSSMLFKNQIPELNSSILPDLSIKFDEKWDKQIEKLNEFVLKGNFKDYRLENTYFPAKLTIEGEKYKVKIKVHGKQPDGHIFNDNVSLKVKFKNNKNPFSSKIVKLIIVHRITSSFDNMKIIGDLFSVIHTEGFWYNVKVNSKENYPYLIQIPIEEDFISNYISKKGFVDFAEAPYNLTHIDSNTKVNFKIKKHAKIKASIDNLRSDIINGKSENVFKYFDEDYIARFTACNLVGGFLGHGFNPENMYILYNSDDNKLYPMITRDNFISPIDKSRNEFEQIKVWEHFSSGSHQKVKNELLSFLFNNLDLRSKALLLIKNTTRNKLIDLIQQNSTFENMLASKNIIKSYLSNPIVSNFDTRLSWKIYKSNLILDNFKHLQNRIETSSYSTHQFLAKDSLTLLIKSHSITPLVFKQFSLPIKANQLNNIRLKVNIGKTCKVDTILNILDSTINFLPIINHVFILDDNDSSSSDKLFCSIKIYFKGKSKFYEHPYLANSFKIGLSSLNSEIAPPSVYLFQNDVSF